MCGGCQFKRALLCYAAFCLYAVAPSIFAALPSVCTPCLSSSPLLSSPFLLSPPLSTLLSRSVFPSPYLSLGLLFFASVCNVSALPFVFHTPSFSAPLSFSVFPLAVCLRPLFSHMLFISASPCLLPVGVTARDAARAVVCQ